MNACLKLRNREGIKREVDDRAKPEPKFDLTSRRASALAVLNTHKHRVAFEELLYVGIKASSTQSKDQVADGLQVSQHKK
jgi:hypothetical protein